MFISQKNKEISRETSVEKLHKRADSLVWSHSPLVLFIICSVVLGSLAPAFGLEDRALANEETLVNRIAPYDFQEQNGISCNSTKQSGSGYSEVSSSPSNGNVKVHLSNYTPSSDGFFVQTLSAEAEGRAGVGIWYIAPKTGRIQIDADVVVKGNDKLQETTLLWVPKGTTALIKSPFLKIVAEIAQIAEIAFDASISALVQSGVEIQAYRIRSTPNDVTNTLFANRNKPFFQPDPPHALPSDIDQKSYASEEPIKDTDTKALPTLILDVIEGEVLSVCVGIKSQVLATSIFPGIGIASVDYDAWVQKISINYLSEQTTSTPTMTPTPMPTPVVQSCGETWSIGQRVPLKKGAMIRQGSGVDYVVHTIVPEDNWPVDVIGGPRCIDGNDWWDISRANIDGGGTGWINRSQAAFVSSSTSSVSTYSGPEPPSYAPSFAGQTVSWNGNSFRSDNGTTWIFQGSDAERAAAEAAIEARELAEAEANAQDAGVYLQKSNLLEPFMDINKNASDYGLRDAEYVIIRGPYKATIYSDYRGGGDMVGIYLGEGTYRLPTAIIGSVKAEVILPPVPKPIVNIPVPVSVSEPAPTQTVVPTPPVAKIAFTSDRDGTLGVYSMDPDGSNQVNFTGNVSNNYSPSWSPDHAKVAFTSDRDGKYRVYVMNADGTEQVALTSSQYHSNEPSWSPDGTKISFTSYPAGATGIYVMNADGSNQTGIALNNDWLNYLSSWSPDGKKIVFLSDRDGNDEVYSMNADGSGQTRLTFTSAPESVAAWSPDGTKIAFTSRRDGHNEVYSMNVDGSNQTRLTDSTSSLWPSWSADSSKIIFVTNRDGNNEIYVMDANGANQTNLTQHPSSDVRLDW